MNNRETRLPLRMVWFWDEAIPIQDRPVFEQHNDEVFYGVTRREFHGRFQSMWIHYLSLTGPMAFRIQISSPPVDIEATLANHDHERIVDVRNRIQNMWFGMERVDIDDFFQDDILRAPDNVSIAVTFADSAPLRSLG